MSGDQSYSSCSSSTRNLPWKSVRTQTHSTAPLASSQQASTLRWLCDTNAWSSHDHAPCSPPFSDRARCSVGEQLSADGNRLLHPQKISAISMRRYGAAYAREDPPKIQHGSWCQRTPQKEYPPIYGRLPRYSQSAAQISISIIQNTESPLKYFLQTIIVGASILRSLFQSFSS